MSRGWSIAAFLAGIAALIGFLHHRYPDALQQDGANARLILLIGWLSVIALGLGPMGRLSASKLVRDGAIWLAVVGGLAVGWSYRAELGSVFGRVSSELEPSRAVAIGDETVLRRSASGHFEAMGAVNGMPVRFLVDTGASRVVLPYETAARAGLDMDALRFTQAVNTANGVTYTAPVRLNSVTVGALSVADVPAFVAQQGDLDGALLGMSFLNRLGGYGFAGDRLTLRP